jgi:hypothetical protein
LSEAAGDMEPRRTAGDGPPRPETTAGKGVQSVGEPEAKWAVCRICGPGLVGHAVTVLGPIF